MDKNGDKEDYTEVVDELESEVSHVEEDFEQIKSKDPSPSLKEKQDRAEEILNEIHEQLDFLKDHMDEINELRDR